MSTFLTTNDPDPVQVPRHPAAGRVEWLLWVFLLSFCLDYRAAEARAGGAGAGLDQLLFLGLASISTFGILLHGWRCLVVRPGVWTITLWLAFLAFMLVNALLQHVDPTRSFRIILPLFLCAAGLLNAHVAACLGVPPSRIVAPVLTAACLNIVWRITHGFLFKGVTLESVRVEVQSAANNWLAAWIGCALLLRQRLHPALPVAILVLFTGIFITVTRSLLLPVAASAAATSVCLFVGLRWRIFRLPDLARRLLPVSVGLGLVLLGIAALSVLEPTMLVRWNERLFHHTADRNVAADISLLTRQAEATAIWEILTRDPVHFIHGQGIGASYYWHQSFMPEIHLVYPPDLELGHEVWFAGHSVWTYALFSGGVIAILAHAGLLGVTLSNSLRGAAANRSLPGPETWLAFLPFVATCCLLSESATSNPFDERLAALIFGVMAGLPQAFFVRASWLHTARP